MAQPAPFSNVESEEDIAQRRKLAMALMGQASDTSPVGHWTQALARAVQGGMSQWGQMEAKGAENDRRKKLFDALTASGTLQSLGEGERTLLSQDPALMKAVAGTAITRKIAPEDKRTPDEKNYERSLIDPAYKAHLLDMKRAGATAITTDMRGENAEAKGIGEGAAKRANDTLDRARTATTTLQRVASLSERLDALNTGKLAPAKANMGAWAKSLGVSDEALTALGIDPKMPGNAQALTALTNRMMVDMIGAGGFPANNFSDADREFLVSTLPRLANEPRANKILVETTRRLAQLDIAKAKALQDFRRTNKGASVDDFELSWATNVARKDMLGDLRSEAEQLSAQAVAPPQMTPVPAKNQDKPLARVRSDEDYDKLKSGTSFIGPDGRVRIKP